MMRRHMVVRDELPVVSQTRSSWSKRDEDRRSVEPSIDVGCSVMIIERRRCRHGSAYHVRFGEWCLAFVPDRSAGEIKANRNPHPRVHEAGEKDLRLAPGPNVRVVAIGRELDERSPAQPQS